MENVIVLRDNQDDEMHNIDLICIGDITEEGLKQVIKSMYDEIDEFEERDETWNNSTYDRSSLVLNIDCIQRAGFMESVLNNAIKSKTTNIEILYDKNYTYDDENFKNRTILCTMQNVQKSNT